MRTSMTLKVAVGSALGTAVVVAAVVLLAGSDAGADPNDAAQVAQGDLPPCFGPLRG